MTRLSPEAGDIVNVAQMVADRVLTPAELDTLIAQYTAARKLAEEAYAKGFRNGTATLAAENTTLRAERDFARFDAENGWAAEQASVKRNAYHYDRAEAAFAELATLRASEAAAMERLANAYRLKTELNDLANEERRARLVALERGKVLTEALNLAASAIRQARAVISTKYEYSLLTGALIICAEAVAGIDATILTPTADKEPKT